MKVIEQLSPVESGGLQQVHAFTIKASAKAFRALSSTLYKNKPLAIIREICANAIDANIAAGQPKYRFDLHLPTQLDSSLIIRDYGNGMSHEDMINTYTTYFESTKTENNDEVGCHGLGSKTPFSYTESFTVTSRHNGIKSLYAAYINAAGSPDLALVSSAETDEHSGLEVLIPTKITDQETFVTAAINALLYYDEKPTCTGLVPRWRNLSHLPICGKNWKIRDESSKFYTGPIAIQGVIAYPITVSDLQATSHTIKLINDLNIDIQFPIGSLDVALSRESLSYDTRTRETLIKTFDEIFSDVCENITGAVSAAPTFWSACLAFQKHNIFAGDPFSTPFKWKHRKLITAKSANISIENYEHISIKSFSLPNVCYDEIAHAQCLVAKDVSLNSKLIKIVNIDVSESVDFFYNDIGRTASGRIKKHIYDSKYARTTYLLESLPTDSEKPKDYVDPLEAFLEDLGNPVVRKVSELEKPIPVKRNNSNKDVIACKIYSDSNYYSSRKNWSTTILDKADIDQGGIFVDHTGGIVNNNMAGSHSWFNNHLSQIQLADNSFKKFAKWLQVTGILESNRSLFAFSSSNVKKLDRSVWFNAFDLFTEWLKAPKLNNKTIEDFENWFDVEADASGINSKTLFSLSEKLKPLLLKEGVLDNHPLIDNLNMIKSTKQRNYSLDNRMRDLQGLIETFKVQEQKLLNGKMRPITTLNLLIEERYPLLHHVSLTGNNISKAIENIAKYIVLIDSN